MIAAVIALIISFIPSLLMFNFLRNNRKDDEDYRKNCLTLFGQGLTVVLVVLLLDLIFSLLWSFSGLGEGSQLLKDIFRCFVINAAVEEFAKFRVSNKYIKKDHAKVSRLDVISYITIAAISFGLLEDIVFMFTTNIGQIIIRGILMGHVPYALLMGRFYGKGLVENNTVYKVLAFAIPILLHGSYNLMLSEYMPDWSGVFVITEVLFEFIFMIYMIFFIRKKREDAEYTSPIFGEDIEETPETVQ